MAIFYFSNRGFPAHLQNAEASFQDMCTTGESHRPFKLLSFQDQRYFWSIIKSIFKAKNLIRIFFSATLRLIIQSITIFLLPDFKLDIKFNEVVTMIEIHVSLLHNSKKRSKQ